MKGRGPGMTAADGASILAAITSERYADAQAAAMRVPVKDLMREARKRRHRSLTARLRAGSGLRVIAETKKASPSAGLLRASYDPAAVARDYAAAGAVGISVLTEPRHFLGGEADLRAVRAAVDLPILRKDFLSTEYQVAEAAAWGADVILVIAGALSVRECLSLYGAACDLGLEVIIEVHDAMELDVALACDKAVIGINNRDLRTLSTDLAVSEQLARDMPPGRLRIAESGLRTRDDLVRLAALGYDGFLIGESLLRQESPGQALRSLVG